MSTAARDTWVDGAAGSGFPLTALPYAVAESPAAESPAAESPTAESPAADGPTGPNTPDSPRIVAGIGAGALDLAAAARAGLLDDPDGALQAPVLNPLMAAGPGRWAALREQLTELLCDPAAEPVLRPLIVDRRSLRFRMPCDISDYVDFYASEVHARNLGRILRPGAPELAPNWKHLPVGYHGRSGTVVVSGTPIVRPRGQVQSGTGRPAYVPTDRLDVEAEVGFLVGTPSTLGVPVPAGAFAEHIFGVVLVADWSARDIQAFETVPLGPFLGKSFLTSISPWVLPLAALQTARRDGPVQDPPPLPHLRRTEAWGIDLQLELSLGGHVISRPHYAGMYWTADQLLAHLTSNGASVRTGDLLASGTVSGPGAAQVGSFVEASANGTAPITLPDGGRRGFLADGDAVTIAATAPGPGGVRIELGEVTGTIAPAAG